MPSNRNNRKKKTPLDLEAMQLLDQFDYNFCKYVDSAFKNKFKDTYVKQIVNAMGESFQSSSIGFSLDSNIFPREKLFYMTKAIGNLYYMQTRLNRLNDMDQLKDDTKAVFDSKLGDIIDGFSRFSSSLRNLVSIAGQVPSGTPYGETNELEGCLTGQNG